LITDHRASRMLLTALFSAGLFYCGVVISSGRFDMGIGASMVVGLLLVCLSLFMKPPTRKGLVLLALVEIAFVLVMSALGLLSEVVLMAAAEIVIYAMTMSEAKFPLTKRALATGIVVGVVMTFLGVYLMLKLGVVYFIGAEMMGAIILSTHGKYTKEENTIVVAIANGSSMICAGILITLPGLVIYELQFKPPLEPSIAPALITLPFIAFLIGTSALFGLILLVPFKSHFDKQPWPQLRPQAECIISMGADKTAKKNVLVGLGGSASYVGATKIVEQATGAALGSIPSAFKGLVPATGLIPDWIGLSNSPLIAAIGFFVGWKRALVLLLGSTISLTIWLVFELAPYEGIGAHLQRPEILYLVFGVFAAVIVSEVTSARRKKATIQEPRSTVKDEQASETRAVSEEPPTEMPSKTAEVPKLVRLKRELMSVDMIRHDIREIAANPQGFLKSRRGQVPPWIAVVSMLMFMAIGIVFFWVITPFAGLQIHWALSVLGPPVALLSVYFTARAISETGMLAGYISDVMAIPAILLFRVSFAAITTFMTMVGAFQDAAIAFLVHLKLGTYTGVKGMDIFKAMSVAAILGTSVGSFIIFGVYKIYGFGGTEFPCPIAQLFVILVTSLMGLGNLQLPYVDRLVQLHPALAHPVLAFIYVLMFGLFGYLLSRQLLKVGLSPISLAVGLLIPPATTATMMIGAFIDYRTKKHQQLSWETDTMQTTTQSPEYDRTSRLLSGVVSGEAIVIAVWALGSAILLFI